MTALSDAPATSVADGSRDPGDAVAGRLPLDVRDDIASVGERVAWAMRFGRKVRVLPILFLLAWPLLAMGFFRDAWRARRLLARDDVREALLQLQWVLFEQAWDDEHPRRLDDGPVRDLALLRHAPFVLSFGFFGPPLILIGFAVVFVLAGR